MRRRPTLAALGAMPLVASWLSGVNAQTDEQSALPALVLVLLDDVERLHPPDYGYTGDWVVRLQQTGYDVAARSAGDVLEGGLALETFSLVVIAFPATLPEHVLRELARGTGPNGVPVLVGATAYVEPLGLGRIWDPTNPNRTIYGTTVEVDPQAAPITEGLTGLLTLAGGPGLEDAPYAHTLYRNPILPAGPVLAWVTDEAGQRQAVWSTDPSGTRQYFGIWWSADGRNHNATYWHLFDASVRALIAAGSAPAPQPSPTPTALLPATVTPLPTATPPATPTMPRPGLPRTGGGPTGFVGAGLTA